MEELSTSPATPEPITTTPDAGDNSGAPDTSTAAGQTPSPAAPGASTPPTSTPQPSQPGQNPQQPGQKQPNMAQAPGAPASAAANTPQVHPLVQKAGILKQTAEALAGGPQYRTTIDPQTGEATRSPVPMSGRQIGLAIALEALSGGLAGLSATGPNAAGKGAALGLQEGQRIAQERQQQQQQQDQQAQQDFARHASVYQNNLKMMGIAQTVGQKDFEQNQEVAAQYKPLADQLQKDYPQYVLGVGSEQDAAKYHATKNTAIPTGRVIPIFNPQTGEQEVGPSGNKLWQQEFMFIDPSFKGDNLLTDDDRKVGEKYGLLPKNLPSNLTMGLSMALNYKHRIVAAGLADQDVQGFYKTLGKDAPDFAAAVKQDPTLIDAMEKFQPLLNATQGNYEHAIGELAAGEKASGRAPDPQAAGKILNLLGGRQNVQTVDQQTTDLKEKHNKEVALQAKYNGPLNPDIATSIKEDPNATPEQKERADKFLTDTKNFKASTSYSSGFNHQKGADAAKTADGVPSGKGGTSNGPGGENDPNLTDPTVQATIKPENYNTSDGRNSAYINALMKVDPQIANLVKAYSDGLNMQSFYASAKKYGASLTGALESYDPSFNVHRVEEYNKAQIDLGPQGKVGSKVVQGNAAIQHLTKLYDDSIVSGNYKGDITPASTEAANYYANGNKATDPEIEHQRDALGFSAIPGRQNTAIKRTMTDIMDKTQALFDREVSTLPRGMKLPDGLVDLTTAEHYRRVTGEDLDPRLISLPDGRGGVMDKDTAKLYLRAVAKNPKAITADDQAAAAKLARQRGWRIDSGQSSGPGPQSSNTAPHPLAGYQYLSPNGQHGWNGQQWVPVAGAQPAAA